MRANLIDVSHLLTIRCYDPPIKQFQQQSNQILKSANCVSSGNIGMGLASRVSNPNNKSLARRASQKFGKKQKRIYEIIDNKKIMLFRNETAVNSYTFDCIKQSNQDLTNTSNWILNDHHKNSQQNQQFNTNMECKLILIHNYELGNIYELITAISKKLLSSGITFHIITSFSNNTDQTLTSARDRRQRRSMSINKFRTFNQNISQMDQKLSKNINFVSQLKQYLNQLKISNCFIQRIWILCSQYHCGFGVYEPLKDHHAVKIINKLITDYQLFIKNQILQKRNLKNVNFNVEISTICEAPEQRNYQKSKRILQQAILLKHNIKCYGIQQKQSLFSFRQFENDEIRYSQSNELQTKNYNNSKFTQPFNRILKQSNYINDKNQLSRKSRKSKANLYQDKNNLDQNQFFKTKNKIYDAQSLKSEESSNEQIGLKNKRRKDSKSKFNEGISQNNLASIMAENIHLKWQMDKMQKQYDQQSRKYIQKMNKKFENIRQQRSFCIQQSAKLRRDNEQLLEQINTLKSSYQQILATRTSYQDSLQEKYKLNSSSFEKNYKQQIQKLQSQIKTLKYQKNMLQQQINDSKHSLQDGRRRNRNRVQQMQQQINKYKKFCEQIKASYDQLQRQARMDKNRCENLEKRIKKYQQSISDLLKIKSGSSVWSEEKGSSQYASISSQREVVNKAIQLVYQTQQLFDKKSKKCDSESNMIMNQTFRKKQQQSTKRKNFKQRRNSQQIKQKNQRDKNIKIKQQSYNQVGKKQKYKKRRKYEIDQGQKQSEPIKHFRLISFAQQDKNSDS